MKVKRLLSTSIALALVGCGPTENPSSGVSDGDFIVKSQTLVLGKLRDTSGVKWRNLYVSRSSGARVLCGEINSKNGFGGYSGFQQFVSGGITFFESEVDSAEWQKVWIELCSDTND